MCVSSTGIPAAQRRTDCSSICPRIVTKIRCTWSPMARFVHCGSPLLEPGFGVERTKLSAAPGHIATKPHKATPELAWNRVDLRHQLVDVDGLQQMQVAARLERLATVLGLAIPAERDQQNGAVLGH